MGGRLARALAARGVEVTGLVRDTGRARDLAAQGVQLHQGDVLDAASIRGAGEGADIAYYLVHGMGRGSNGDFTAARAQGRRATSPGWPRRRASNGWCTWAASANRPPSTCAAATRPLASSAAEGPPLTYFRAAMVVGAGSESYRTLRYLVQRLPAMIAPAWLATPTQPIAADDVVDYLVQAAEAPDSAEREVQIGGPDVLSYGDMLDRMASALGLRRRPKLSVPLLSPTLSSHWIGLVTPVDADVARPLVEGLTVETVVTDPPARELFDVDPIGFDEALRRALAEDPA